jgi:hypothetical protein
VVSASTFPLCPPLWTPKPPAVNHFSPFRATFFGIFLPTDPRPTPKIHIQRKTAQNPQVGPSNAPIPTGAHRHPHRPRGFTPAAPHPDPRISLRRDADARDHGNLGSNERSCSDITRTRFSRTGIIDQELFIVSTNRRSWPSSSLTPTSTRCSRHCGARRR